MKVLMVCLGNICRSPMAEGILKHKTEDLGLDWLIDSAGTSGFHDGEGPDYRAIKYCKTRNIDISRQISRSLVHSDFIDFDLILAMDAQNYQDILKKCPKDYHHKVKMVCDLSISLKGQIVPDPYYDGQFSKVFEILDKCFDEFLKDKNQGHLIEKSS